MTRVRPTFPHSRDDVTRAVDGPFGLVVADVPDGRIFVLKRARRPAADGTSWTLTEWADPARSRQLAERRFTERETALSALYGAVGL